MYIEIRRTNPMAKSHEMLEEELSYITLPNIQKRQSFWGGRLLYIQLRQEQHVDI